MALPKSTVSKWCVSSITYDKKNYGNIGVFNALQVAWNVLTRCGRNVMRLILYLPKFLFFSNVKVIPFTIVPLGSYTPMETLFPLLVSSTGMVFSMSVTIEKRKKKNKCFDPLDSSKISLVLWSQVMNRGFFNTILRPRGILWALLDQRKIGWANRRSNQCWFVFWHKSNCPFSWT